MRESSLYTALNLASGDRLPDILAAAREDGKTYDEIVLQLLEDTGIRVSREWVRQQVSRLDMAS